MYLALLAFGLIFQYVPLYVLFSSFFGNSPIWPTGRMFAERALLLAVYIAFIFWLSFLAFEPNFGNRVLHGLGGGFLSFMICFLVVYDARLRIGRLRFFIFSLLVVTGLGVMNELIEFFVQAHSHMIFAETTVDTWQDLASNTIGALMAAAVFTRFLKPATTKT